MGIDVNIVAGETLDTSSVVATGFVQEKVSNKEIDKIFGSLYKMGLYASQYLKIPQLMTIRLDNLSKIASVENAEIVTITSQPVVVKTQNFVNNSDLPGTFNVSITDTVQNTSTNTWQVGGSITVTQKINYGIDFLVSGKGETSISYTQSWGIGGSHSVAYTVGSSSGVSVNIGPHQAIKASLSASRGNLRTKVNYMTALSGSFSASSSLGAIRHNIDIQDFMRYLNKDPIQRTSEIIDVGYYSSSTIIIDNLNTGQSQVHYV